MNQLAIPFINIILLLIGLGLMLPIATFFLECSAAWLPKRRKTANHENRRPKIAVLVPAHNEVSGIAITLKTLLPQLTNQDRLVVIADNCEDETAAVARQFGVTVIERYDSEHKGKGYALDFGLNYIAAEPPEVVVTVDADCTVHPGTIDGIACLAAASTRPVQSTYLMAQPDNPTPKDAISALAVKVKNLVRPTGLLQLGQPCLLTGSGIAFPWSVIDKVSFANSKTVDDMQLGLDLAIAGHPPIFCPQARTTGRLMEKEAAKSQRARWEHGHIETMLTEIPKLLIAAVTQKRFDLLMLALEMSIPPLSLLLMMWVATMTLGLLGGVFLGIWTPSILFAIEGLIILISIVGTWMKFGRNDISALQLITIPFYILWKIPLYLAFLVNPQTRWIRTERDIVDA